MTKGYRYTLFDIGLVINQLMGSGFSSQYSRKKFQRKYTEAKSSTLVTSSKNIRPTTVSFAPGSYNGNAVVGSPMSMSNLLPPSEKPTMMKSSASFLLNWKNKSKNNVVEGGNSNLGSPAMNHESPQPNHSFEVDPLDSITFEYPFSELMIWAVLTKRQEMAKLMWKHGIILS